MQRFGLKEANIADTLIWGSSVSGNRDNATRKRFSASASPYFPISLTTLSDSLIEMYAYCPKWWSCLASGFLCQKSSNLVLVGSLSKGVEFKAKHAVATASNHKKFGSPGSANIVLADSLTDLWALCYPILLRLTWCRKGECYSFIT